MIKRFIAFIAAIIIAAPPLFCFGAVVVADCDEPFAFYDNRRAEILSGSYDFLKTVPSPVPENGDNYIVTFRGAKSDVAAALEGLSYRPLAYSDELVFLVTLNDADLFAQKNNAIIKYIEPDGICAATAEYESEDTQPDRWELACMNALALPYDTIGDISGITVALLDSGINRSHPALEGANILDGFDITEGHAKVTKDLSGHGTRIAGILVARTSDLSADGIARSATILPVRISANGKDIMTSDLVDAIYMAADAGANIINMSFGGYERIAAEEDAVAYAASKGCLLVAAAGNEGANRNFAGQYSYPASYDNVISVASVGQNGMVCGFSQYNDMVDIAAPGEQLSLLGSNGGVTYDNGTSYSAAYVSAAAALAEAYAGRTFSSVAFERLLEYSCNNPHKSDYEGYGVLNISALLDNCRLPIIFGVSDGVTCFDRVNISFDGRFAVLDNEPFTGGSIYTHGNHTLVVTNDYGTRTVSFMLDTMKLDYIYRDFSSYCIFAFSRGFADIDGIPYASGTRYKYAGKHVFTLHGPNGNNIVREFYVSTGLPTVSGVSDGGVYNGVVCITVSSGGIASLDGVPFENEIFVTENGPHTLELSDISGVEASVISFSIDADYSFVGKLFDKTSIVTSCEYGFAALYSKGSDEIILLSLDDLEAETRITLSDGISGMFMSAGRLIVAHGNTVGAFDAAELLTSPSEESLYTHTSTVCEIASYDYEMFIADSEGAVYAINHDEARLLFTADGIPTVFAFSGSLAIGTDTEITVLDTATAAVLSSLSTDKAGKLLCANEDYICCTKCAFSTSSLSQITGYRKATYGFISGDMLITDYGIISLSDNTQGVFCGSVCGASSNAENTYVLYSDGRLCVVPSGLYLYGAAAVGDVYELPYSFSPFETVIPCSSEKALDLAVVGDILYVIYDNTPCLYRYDSKTMEYIGALALDFIPCKLASNGTEVAMIFYDCDVVWSSRHGYTELNLKPTDIAIGEDSIYVVADGIIMALSTSADSFIPVLTNIYAEAIEVHDGVLYVSAAFDISAFLESDLSLVAATSNVMGGELRYSNGYLMVGGYILSGTDLSLISACNSAAYVTSGGAAITSRGLFSIADERYINRTNSGITNAVSDADGTVYIIIGDTVRRVAFYGDPAASCNMNVEDNSVIQLGEALYCENGIMYLDGTPIENGYVPPSGGTYTLTAVMPWGVSETVRFAVKYNVESISLHLSRAYLTPGDSAILTSTILPKGAEGNITYYVEGDCVELTEGVVTALSVGDAKIVAAVDGTDIMAICNVTVSRDKLVCTDPAYCYDTVNDTISGIYSGTTVEKLISSFNCDSSNLRVVTPDGMVRKSGIVSTGCQLIYRSGDVDIDIIDIAVVGDLDGDGFVTVNDANTLYLKLRSETELDSTVFLAADINKNGILTGGDLMLLTSLISHTPHTRLKSAASPSIDAPSIIGGSCTFSVIVTAGNLTGSSMMATLCYDSEVLEYLSSSYYEGSVSVSSSEGKLFFTALDMNALSEERIIKVYFRVKKSGSGDTALRITDGEMFDGEMFAVSDAECTIRLASPSPALAVTSGNSNLTFVPSTTRYDISVLKDAASLDLNFSLPNGSQIFLPDLGIGDETVYVVKYVTSSGAQTDYTFYVTLNDSLPEPPSAALLKTLSVIGCEFESAFDSNTFIYNTVVESDCEVVRLDYDPVNSGTLIVLDAPERLVFGNNIFTVYCTAENGNKATYTVIVTRAEPEPPELSLPDEASEPPDAPSDAHESDLQSLPTEPYTSSASSGDDPIAGIAVTAIYLTAAALLAAAFIVRRRLSNR